MSLTVALAEIWAELSSIKKRLPSVSPATVTSVGPVRIQVDGQTAPVAASPDTLVPVGPGDRVRVLRYGTTNLILGRINVAGRPWREASGASSVTANNEAVASTTVSYPPGRFTLPPVVTLEAHSVAHGATASDRTAAGFTLNVRRYDAAAFTGSVPVHWRATQASPPSAEG